MKNILFVSLLSIVTTQTWGAAHPIDRDELKEYPWNEYGGPIEVCAPSAASPLQRCNAVTPQEALAKDTEAFLNRVVDEATYEWLRKHYSVSFMMPEAGKYWIRKLTL